VLMPISRVFLVGMSLYGAMREGAVLGRAKGVKLVPHVIQLAYGNRKNNIVKR
jgi:hypothetical protein